MFIGISSLVCGGVAASTPEAIEPGAQLTEAWGSTSGRVGDGGYGATPFRTRPRAGHSRRPSLRGRRDGEARGPAPHAAAMQGDGAAWSPSWARTVLRATAARRVRFARMKTILAAALAAASFIAPRMGRRAALQGGDSHRPRPRRLPARQHQSARHAQPLSPEERGRHVRQQPLRVPDRDRGVNGTALGSGSYPDRNGIMGNRIYIPRSIRGSRSATTRAPSSSSWATTSSPNDRPRGDPRKSGRAIRRGELGAHPEARCSWHRARPRGMGLVLAPGFAGLEQSGKLKPAIDEVIKRFGRCAAQGWRHG